MQHYATDTVSVAWTISLNIYSHGQPRVIIEYTLLLKTLSSFPKPVPNRLSLKIHCYYKPPMTNVY